MKHSAGTRILSTILALLLMGGCLPLTALAAEAEVQPPAGLSSEEADTSGVPEVSPGEPQETDLPAGDSALPLAGEENLALGQPVTVSGTAEDSSGAELVDGNTAVGEKGWITEDMKNGTTPGQAQTPVWAVIDLGAEASTVSSIVIQWRNNKVWATNYVIQTAATNGEDTQWTTVAEVDRDAADRNGTLAQGEGQTIADEAAYRDTITLTSVPALTNATLQRYVRFCFTRVNDLAPGNNLNVAEIQIMGFSAPTEPDDEKPAAPTNLTAAPASDSAVLTWTEATDNAAVALYQIYLGDAADPTATTTETTYTLTGLEPEMEYTVKVTAVDTSLNESDAASVTFTTEAAPVIDWDVEFSEDFEDGIDSGLWADKYGNAQTASAPAEPKGLSFDAGQEQTALVWSSEDLLNGVISVWYYSDLYFFTDITIATKDAWTTDTHFWLNMVPGDGIQIAWRSLMGIKRFNYAELTGEIITAKKALEYGMINEIEEDVESAYRRAHEIATLIMRSSTRQTRRLTVQIMRWPWRKQIAEELRGSFATEMWNTLSEASPHYPLYWEAAKAQARATKEAEAKGKILRPRVGPFIEEDPIV